MVVFTATVFFPSEEKVGYLRPRIDYISAGCDINFSIEKKMMLAKLHVE